MILAWLKSRKFWMFFLAPPVLLIVLAIFFADRLVVVSEVNEATGGRNRVLGVSLGFFYRDFEISGFSLCQSPTWRAERGLGWAEYGCVSQCPNAHWQECIYESPDAVDAQGRSLQRLAFVADGMAGELEWNLPYGDNEDSRAVLFTHQGGGGTTFIGGTGAATHEFLNELEKEGIVVVGVKWQSGLWGPPMGWFTHRYPGERSSLFEKSKRPVAVLRWVSENLVFSDQPLGTLSCSGGTVAMFSAVYWHGLDELIDYQLLGGGPPAAWDVAAVCTGQPGEEEPAGICENNPEQTCQADRDCENNFKCATLNPVQNIHGLVLVKSTKSLIDYMAGEKNICLDGLAKPEFDASSYHLTAGDWEYDHPVDFVVSIEGEPENNMLLNRVLNSDTVITVAYTAGLTYRHVSTSDALGKGWHTYQGSHCAWLLDRDFLQSEIKPLILRGLKLLPKDKSR